MSSSAHIDNKKNEILILGKGPTQGLEHTLSAEKIYSINFTATKNFALACITIEQIIIFFQCYKKLQIQSKRL